MRNNVYCTPIYDTRKVLVKIDLGKNYSGFSRPGLIENLIGIWY
jgi:hypothetical protein